MRFAEKVQTLLDLREMIPADLCRRTGIEPARISDWTNGKGGRNGPPLKKALLIARALAVPLDYLADDDAETVPGPEVTEDERAILGMVRDLGLSRVEAVRALAVSVNGGLKTSHGSISNQPPAEQAASRSKRRA